MTHPPWVRYEPRRIDHREIEGEERRDEHSILAPTPKNRGTESLVRGRRARVFTQKKKRNPPLGEGEEISQIRVAAGYSLYM